MVFLRQTSDTRLMASFYKRGTAQWEVKIRKAGYPHQARTFATKLQAEKWARQIEAEFDKGIFVDRSEAEKNTLYGVLDRYKQEVTPLKHGAAEEAIRINALMREPFTKTKMAALSASMFAEYRDRRLKEVSGSTVNRDFNLISAVINHARKEWGIPMENPIALVRRPAVNRPRDRRLSAEEEQALLAACDVPQRVAGQFTGPQNRWLKPIVQVALETAMRAGELLALEWQRVDLENRTLEIVGAKSGTDLADGERRIVPLTTRAVEILRGLSATESPRVFPISSDALKKGFARAVKRAGITGLVFHDLRHEGTSRLAVMLPNLIELASVTGHKDLRMLRRYYHPRAADLVKKLT